jgi:hypothetical protein
MSSITRTDSTQIISQYQKESKVFYVLNQAPRHEDVQGLSRSLSPKVQSVAKLEN